MIISTSSKYTLQHNQELSDIFARMSECYQLLGPEQRFRANAYENVSKTLALMQEPIDEYADSIAHLDTLKGIGESIAEKIIEYLKTGKINAFTQLQKKVPYQLISLMHRVGLGPATLRQLYDQLGIRSPKELVDAVKAGKLEGLKGYGAKKIANIKRSLQIEEIKKRVPYADAAKIAEKLVSGLKKNKRNR